MLVETKLNLTISATISTKGNINRRDLHEDMFLIIILIETVLNQTGQQFCIVPEKIIDSS